jgi:hypothetical protein
MLRLVLAKPEGLTEEKLRAKRKREMLSYNMSTFGNVAIGIHEKELPKFSHLQYKKTPNVTSSLKLGQRYIPGCEMQGDPFKEVHVARHVNSKVANKVQHVNPFDEYLRRTSVKANRRWTEGPLKKSVYDLNPCERASEIKYEQLPLPSSFTKSGIFPDSCNKER